MSHVNLSSEFLTRTDTNRHVQPQKMARGLTIRISGSRSTRVEELYYYEAKTRALISSAVTAQLVCFFIFAYAKSMFTFDKAHIKLLFIRSK